MSPWLSDLFLSSQSDERLVALARAGHDRAFAAIVQRYRTQLYYYARQLIAPGRAEDVVQQAFLNAFAALRRGADVTHLRGWLYEIVRNAALRDVARARGQLDRDSDVWPVEAAEDAIEQRLMARAVLTEVARLPDRQRDALVGMAIHGRSRAEVATGLGLSEGAVRQLVHRARATLRNAVTGVTPFPIARWLASARWNPGTGQGAELVLGGAASASTAGVALKLGALVVSGALAGGLVASQLGRHAGRLGAPRRAHVAARGHVQARVASLAPAGSSTRSESTYLVAAAAYVAGPVRGGGGAGAVVTRGGSIRSSGSHRVGRGHGDGTSGRDGGGSAIGSSDGGGTSGSSDGGGTSGSSDGGRNTSGSSDGGSTTRSSSDGGSTSGSSDGGSTSGSSTGGSTSGSSTGGSTSGSSDGGSTSGSSDGGVTSGSSDGGVTSGSSDVGSSTSGSGS